MDKKNSLLKQINPPPLEQKGEALNESQTNLKTIQSSLDNLEKKRSDIDNVLKITTELIIFQQLKLREQQLNEEEKQLKFKLYLAQKQLAIIQHDYDELKELHTKRVGLSSSEVEELKRAALEADESIKNSQKQEEEHNRAFEALKGLLDRIERLVSNIEAPRLRKRTKRLEKMYQEKLSDNENSENEEEQYQNVESKSHSNKNISNFTTIFEQKIKRLSPRRGNRRRQSTA